MPRIRKNVSLDEEVLLKAQEKANRMFAGNFSMYLTYLINQDCEGIKVVKKLKPDEKHSQNNLTIDEDTRSELDNILDL